MYIFWVKIILIKLPTRVTSSSSTIIDHLLSSRWPSGRTCKNAVINIGWVRLPPSIIAQSWTWGSQIEVKKKTFQKSHSIRSHIGLSDHQLMYCTRNVIGKVAPIKERQIKQNSQKLFDWEVANGIKNRERSFKKFKK